MRDIPLDLERRFEQRWAARFSGPAKEHRLEGQQRHQWVIAPDKSKTGVEPAGSRAQTRASAQSLAIRTMNGGTGKQAASRARCLGLGRSPGGSFLPAF